MDGVLTRGLCILIRHETGGEWVKGLVAIASEVTTLGIQSAVVFLDTNGLKLGDGYCFYALPLTIDYVSESATFAFGSDRYDIQIPDATN